MFKNLEKNSIFKKLGEHSHEEIHFRNCEETGLKAIIAIHSTALGPTTGGTRVWNYENEEEALYDVLRLSRGMSYKNAVSGVLMGGAKAVIIWDTAKPKTRELMLAYGKFVDSLGGKFTTGEDVNMSVSDVQIMAEVTSHIAGIPGEGRGGDPSPYTARGVFRGLQAGAMEAFGDKSFKGKTVAVQGLGKVGYDLCKWLHEDGAKLIVTDINKEAIERAKKEFGAVAVEPSEIINVECDVFAPCAMGAVISEEIANKIKCKLIGGSANNVLVDPAAGEALHKKGILYLPDYVINAGGVISVYLEIKREHTHEKANEKMDGIYDNVKNILDFAKEKNIATYRAADEYAQKIILEASPKNSCGL
ncbi:MAG: leucine dehydrogenase [Defluviitaleaceae bacterium]|nr:leucine dehydrogenase [Defluviitaleaceae bacterium]